MGVNMFVGFSILLLISFQTGRNMAIHININPQTYDQTVDDEVNITCTPDGVDDRAKEILLMEIVKDDDKAVIVVMRSKMQPSLRSGNRKRFVASGLISKNVSKSYLSLTLQSYKSSDSGEYSCVMYFLDENGFVQKEMSSLNLTEDLLDMKRVGDALESMKDMNKDLQQTVADQSRQIADLLVKANTLDEKSKNQSQQITSLKDKVDYTVAFSATNKNSNIKTTDGQALIFDTLIMQVGGQGYDIKTGIFTAPIHGVYVFHLVSTDSINCPLNIYLKVNDKFVAVLFTRDQNFWDQSSVSTVAELKPGDKVLSVPDTSGCLIYREFRSVFTGYLIQAW